MTNAERAQVIRHLRKTGTTVGTFTYDAYGKQTASTLTAKTAFGYAGQYSDGETGFQYLRARYYDPTTATFLTRDPMVAATRSAYGYTGGNPLNGTDPSGLSTCGDWTDPGSYVDCAAKAADDAKVAARVVVNATPTPIDPVPPDAIGAAWAVFGGGNCYLRGSHVECDGVSGVASQITFGDVILNGGQDRLKDDRWRHETNHSNQWAAFGGTIGFGAAYGFDWVVHGGNRNCMWFEQAAGAEAGGYDSCGCG